MAETSATVAFAKKGMIEWRSGWPMALMALAGGVLGALSISLLPRATLEASVPVLLIAVAGYFTFAPNLEDRQQRAKMSLFAFSLSIPLVVGFYDEIFGPGTGSFFMLAFMLLLGQGVLRAVSNSKLLNASCNLGALLVFSLSGALILPVALNRALAAGVGAQFGARCAVRFGSRLIKPLLITACCLMAGKLMLTPGNPINQFWFYGDASGAPVIEVPRD
ncbi:hypothetical protein D3C80_1288880 [compost metagenome]